MQVSPVQPDTQPHVQSLETLALDVGGMKCAGCVKAVERKLSQVPGVALAKVNLATEMATVACEPGVVNPETLAQTLTEGVSQSVTSSGGIVVRGFGGDGETPARGATATTTSAWGGLGANYSLGVGPFANAGGSPYSGIE